MSNETKRMNYFNGLLLKEEDLTLDQNYHIQHQRLHNGSFHEWGVVDGLDVEEVPNLPQIIVKQGLALNKVIDTNTNMMIGQEIWICENHPDNPVDLKNYTTDDNIYIFVRYKEEESDVESKKGGERKIHKWERAEIKHSNKKPENPREDVIIACVKLKKDINNKDVIDTENIKYDYIVDKDGQKVTVRTYAVTDGNSQEFGQIRIGNKERINLPHIDGKIENNKDGLEINSPFTNFTGKVTSDGLLTTGEAVVNGTLTVNTNNKRALQVSSEGNVMIGTNAAVSGTLSASGGMIVTGGSTNIETPTVSFKGNMLTINNNADVIQDNSGVTVYRGKDNNNVLKPQAMLVWDEKGGVWKAGTESKEGDAQTGLYNLLYGSEWETMRNKSLADEYHRHNGIYDPKNKFVGLSVNESVNVVIPNSVIVSESIVAGKGIETANNDDEPAAKLFWNRTPTENAAVGQWQITDNKGNTYDVAYGDTWKELSQQKNADLYHHHAVMCAKDGNVTLNTNEAGNIEVSNDLTVKKNLIVDGNIDVKGVGLQSIKMEQVVSEKTLIVNKPEEGKELAAEGGLEVYRGEGLENAKLIWDEGSNKWKIGTGDVLTELPSGDKWERVTGGGIADGLHNHRNLYSEDGVSVISVDKNKNVKIDGNISASNGLSVARDAQIKGALTVDGSVILNGNITVTGKQTIIDKEIVKVNNSSVLVNQYKSQSTPIENEGGLEVYRGGNVPNARFVWNETEKLWKIGIGEELKTLPCGEEWDTLTDNYLADGMHKHSRLYDTKGNSALDINQNGDVSIDNNAYVNGALLVDGSLKVNGKLIYDNVTELVNKESIVTNESIISLNNGTNTIVDKGGIEIFRGDKPKARFIWDENSKVWKVGIGENLREINPVQLYNDRGDTLALSVRTSGNVDVAHDLLVGQDLTIMGCLDVRGQLTRINSSNIEILSNTVVLNRFDEGTLAEHSKDSGITVFRGKEKDSPASAALVWSEKDLCWKIGLVGDQKAFKVQSDGSVNSHSYKVQDTLMINNEGIFSNIGTGYGIGIVYGSDRWKIGSKSNPGLCVTADGSVGIANIDPKEKLDVIGNAKVSGSISIGDKITAAGDLTINGNSIISKDLNVNGNSTVTGDVKAGSIIVGNDMTITKAGIEINRDPNNINDKSPAKIIWDEESVCWKFGAGNEYLELSIEGKDTSQLPTELYSKDKTMVVVSTDDKGKVVIGAEDLVSQLEVNGDVKVVNAMEAKSIVSTSATINGKVSAATFQTPRSNGDKNPAILRWDDEQKSWQVGVEGEQLNNILTSDHFHDKLVGKNTNITILDDDSIKVGDNVTVKKDGIIETAGNIIFGETISGKNASLTDTLTVKNITTSGNLVSKVGTTTLGTTTISTLTVNGGLRVAQGEGIPKAQIMWEEGKWKAGIEGTMTEISLLGHTHPEITGVTNNISNVLKISNNNIGIGGEADTANKLYVYGDTKISGKTTLGTTTISTLTVNGGLKVAQGEGIPKAQIMWEEGKWKAGIEGTMTEISLLGHTHTELTGITNISNALKVANGNIGIGADADTTNKLYVSGAAKVSGKLTVDCGNIGTDPMFYVLGSAKISDKISSTIGSFDRVTINKGLRVSRGKDSSGNVLPSAIIRWNEETSSWQTGLVTTTAETSGDNTKTVYTDTYGEFKDICYTDHRHTALKSATDPTKDVLKVTSVEEIDNIEIGTDSKKANLDVFGKITVSDGIGIKSDGNVCTLKIQSDTENNTYKLVLEINDGTNKVNKEIAFV